MPTPDVHALDEQIDRAAHAAVDEACFERVSAHHRANAAETDAERLLKIKRELHVLIDRHVPSTLAAIAADGRDDDGSALELDDSRSFVESAVDQALAEVEWWIEQNQRRPDNEARPTQGNPGTPQRRRLFREIMQTLVDEHGVSQNAAARRIAERAVRIWGSYRLTDEAFARLWGTRSYISRRHTVDERRHALSEQIRTDYAKNTPVRKPAVSS